MRFVVIKSNFIKLYIMLSGFDTSCGTESISRWEFAYMSHKSKKKWKYKYVNTWFIDKLLAHHSTSKCANKYTHRCALCSEDICMHVN